MVSLALFGSGRLVMTVIAAALRVLAIFTAALFIASDTRLETLAIPLFALGIATATKYSIASTRRHKLLLLLQKL